MFGGEAVQAGGLQVWRGAVQAGGLQVWRGADQVEGSRCSAPGSPSSHAQQAPRGLPRTPGAPGSVVL